MSPAGQTSPASFASTSSAAPDFVLVTTGSSQAIASSVDSGDGIVERGQHERVRRAVPARGVLCRPSATSRARRRPLRARARDNARACRSRPAIIRCALAEARRAPRSRRLRRCARSPSPRAGTRSRLRRCRYRCAPPPRLSQLRVKDVAVDGVVDDVELRFGQAEAVADFIAAPSANCRSRPAATGSRRAASRRRACSGCRATARGGAARASQAPFMRSSCHTACTPSRAR